jgi:class 3 adenylate cyclase
VVNGAARITALAHGGQILLSQALWASLKDSVIEQEKRVVALGKFELPDSPLGTHTSF